MTSTTWRRGVTWYTAAGLVGWLLLVAVTGCAGGSTRVAASAPDTTTSPATGLKVVTYRGAAVDVPADWPVYDLSADPSRCARFDIHAVYLGHQGSAAVCPAKALGKTEAVQVEPLDTSTQQRVLPSPSTTDVDGEPVGFEPYSDASHNIVATFPHLGIVVTASYGSDRALARQIVTSVRKSAP